MKDTKNCFSFEIL